MSLALSLSASSGPLEAVSGLAVPCFGLLPNKVKEHLKSMLHHQPWNETFELKPVQGLTTSEEDALQEFVKLMDPEHLKFILQPACTTLYRCRLVSQLCQSSQFEIDFWTMACAVLDPASH